MPVSRDVALDRFARLIKRVLSDARDRNLTIRQIEERTGVGRSTFLRWQRGEFGVEGPQPEKVRAFFDGLEVPVKAAFDMLDWTAEDVAVSPAPEPTLPPEIRELLRRLRDPNVPRDEKVIIEETLKMLIARRLPTLGAAAPKSTR